MPRTTVLLGRLLPLLAPLSVLSGGGCTPSPPAGPIEPTGTSPRFDPDHPTPPPRDGAVVPGAASSQPLPSTASAPGPGSSVSPSGGLGVLPKPTALPTCSGTFFVKTNPMRSGGPYRQPACYIRAGGVPGAAAPCLAPSSPRLMEALPNAQYASCVERGPEEQADKKTGEPACCYVLGIIGEGRPFLVVVAGSAASTAPQRRRLVAELVPAGPQNAWT